MDLKENESSEKKTNIRLRKSQKRGIKRNTPRDLQREFNQRYIADFKKHGIRVIEKVREDNPVEYLKIAVRLLPKDVNFHVEHTFNDVLREAQDKIAQREALRKQEKVIEGKAEIVEVEDVRKFG